MNWRGHNAVPLQDAKTNHNATLTQTVPVIKAGNTVEMMQWCFRPFWMKDKPDGYSLFNAKSEDAFHRSTWHFF
ncbi:MAG: SOS response-associated peptidase family protein [Methylophilaceae bacterium]|nr:SOS response-associated peptidase family protein [Methylophilaceae bacterium]